MRRGPFAQLSVDDHDVWPVIVCCYAGIYLGGRDGANDLDLFLMHPEGRE